MTVTRCITISEEIADIIREETFRLMNHYDYDSNGSDYECVFCLNRPKTNNPTDIVHDANCKGNRILDALNSEK
jgi:hypothetical protein